MTHDRAFRRIRIGDRPFLVEDRYLREGAGAAIVHVAEPLDTLERTFKSAREAMALVLAPGGRR